MLMYAIDRLNENARVLERLGYVKANTEEEAKKRYADIILNQEVWTTRFYRATEVMKEDIRQKIQELTNERDKLINVLGDF